MNCEQVAPYLPGIAGGELGADTTQWIEAHLATCTGCRTDAARYRTLAGGLATLASKEITPPPFLADAIIERVQTDRRRRFLPIPPLVAPDVVRVVQDNRDMIASAGALIVAAGAVYALWRAVRRVRPGLRPAAS